MRLRDTLRNPRRGRIHAISRCRLNKLGHSRQVARFDGFEFDPRAGELRQAPGANGSENGNGSVISLPEQPYRILAMLLERPGEVLTRQEIRDALWPDGTVVEFDHSISVAMNRLRQALGDSAEEPRYIETLSRRGYRWKLPVNWIDARPDTAIHDQSSAHAPSYKISIRLLAAGAFATVLIIGAIMWLVRPRVQPAAPRAAPRFRQLTNNSFENRVLSGAISPDGKFIAYSDVNGIRIRLLATGETRSVPSPENMKASEVNWQIVGTWLTDSSGFVANARTADLNGLDETHRWSSQSSVWSVSVLGGAPHKLRDDAAAFAISPDGASLAFGTNTGTLGSREIWLMTPNGEQQRKLIAADGDSALSALQWSADGKRFLYLNTDPAGTSLLENGLQNALEARPPTVILGPSETKKLVDFYWRPDGRLLYSVENAESFDESSCNLFELPLDAKPGQTLGKSRPLTNWPALCFRGMSSTSNGKQLAFLKTTSKLVSFVGDLPDSGTRIVNPRHFPLNENSEAIVDWAPDGKAVFLVSDRSGDFEIYKQFLDQDVAEPIVTSGYGRNPRVMPGGENLIYLGIGEKGKWPARGPEPVMKVSATGGSSQRLFTAHPYSLINCPRNPSGVCIIAEPTDDGAQLIVTVIDPVKGRGAELFRFPIVAGDDSWYIDLAPDGTRIAATRTMAGPIHILSLNGTELQQIEVKRTSKLLAVVWDSDSKGFLATASVRNGRELLHVDMHGDSKVLWTNLGGSGETLATPSPDGRRLAFNGWTTSGNIWTLEDF